MAAPQSRRPKHATSSVEAVLLDAAGTLIRLMEPVGATYARAAEQCGVKLDLDKLSQAFTAVFADMPDLAFDWSSMTDLRRQERDWWRALVSRVIALTGNRIRNFDAFFETLFDYYARPGAWECFPEVPAVLRALRARGCRLAVVSNFDSRLPGLLRELEIADRVDAVVYSSEAGSAKPDPVIFEKALAALGVTAERAIHVGDNHRADVEGAAAAGIKGLWIRRSHSLGPSSVEVIGSLEELSIRLESVPH